MNKISFLCVVLLCMVFSCNALAENPVTYLTGWQKTQSEESYYGTWAFDCAVNDNGTFAIDGITADTYQLTIGPGWYVENISGYESAFPTIHAGAKLMCLQDDHGTPAYFRLFLGEDGRLFTPMGSGENAFTAYFTHVDDKPGTFRGTEVNDVITGSWFGTPPPGVGMPDEAEGCLTFQSNGTVRFESPTGNVVGLWTRTDDGIKAAWVNYTSDLFTLTDNGLVADLNDALYTRDNQ